MQKQANLERSPLLGRHFDVLVIFSAQKMYLICVGENFGVSNISCHGKAESFASMPRN